MPSRERERHNVVTSTCRAGCKESQTPCLKCLQSTHPNLLAFRLPARKPDEPEPPPPEAAFGDKLQWFAGNQPHVLEVLAHMAEAMLEEFRPAKIYIPRRRLPRFSPTPAMTVELTGDLRYRAIRVFDTDCLVAPIEGRIGKYMADVMPADLTARFMRCLERARRDLRPRSYTYQLNGITYRSTIFAPSEDTVAVTVTRLNQN